MTKPKDGVERYMALMNALAEHTASIPDQDLLDDAVASGIDIKAEAARVGDILLGAVLSAKKERSRNALQEHQRNIASISACVARLPADPRAQEALLARTLQRRPEMRHAIVTLQNRNFESFSARDVESALKHLFVLGLLDDEPESKS